MGDKRIDSLVEGINSFKDNIEYINLSKNNLTDTGATLLLKNFTQKIQYINLSYNKISINACTQLVQIMSNNNYSLREINVEGNKIGNKAASILISGCMKQGSNIIKLNLSKNDLTETIAPLLKDLVSTSHDLAELYLHWNQLGQKGGSKQLAEGMMQNFYLKVLDLSHNQLGNQPQATQIWCQVFQRDSKMDLIHLDFSFNNFNFEECKQIALALESNHQIYGFHFEGQQCNVQMDLKGFVLIPDQPSKFIQKSSIFSNSSSANQTQNNKNIYQSDDGDSLQLNQSQIIQHRIDGTKAIKGLGNFLNNNNKCWICGGWEEKTFYWQSEIISENNIQQEEQIFIHFSVDDWMPHLMVKKDANSNVFSFTKIFPPSLKINYFFTVLGNQLLADDQPKEQSSCPEIQIKFADFNIFCMMEELNQDFSRLNRQFFSKDYTSQYKCKPREKEINYLMPKKEVIHIPWSYEKSIFKEWKKDNTSILDSCFEIDWKRSKIEKLIKNKDEMNEFKEFLRSKYKDIKETYKNYSSYFPSGDVWSLNQNIYSEFVQVAQIVDGKTYYLKDSDFHFISCNAQPIQYQNQENNNNSNNNVSSYTKNKNNPPKQLIRHQFLEILVRLCDDKYIKTKKCQTMIEAFRQMLSDGLSDAMDSVDCEQDWRNSYYWTEQNDICLKYYKPLIDHIYRKYAGTINRDFNPIKTLSLDEFKQICYNTGIVGEHLTDRDLNMAYSLSMMTQVDEIDRNRHTQMHVIEFMEALTRVADSLNPLPYGFEEQAEKWEKIRLINLDLNIKLESLLNLIYKTIPDKELKQVFKMPEKSLFHKEIHLIHEGKDQQLQGRQAIKKNSIQQSQKIFRRSRVSRSTIHSQSSNRERKISNFSQLEQKNYNNNSRNSIKRSQSNQIAENNNNNDQQQGKNIFNQTLKTSLYRQNSFKHKTIVTFENSIQRQSSLKLQDNDKNDEKSSMRQKKLSVYSRKQRNSQSQNEQPNLSINLPKIFQKQN